jgi:hypothetical protein
MNDERLRGSIPPFLQAKTDSLQSDSLTTRIDNLEHTVEDRRIIDNALMSLELGEGCVIQRDELAAFKVFQRLI